MSDLTFLEQFADKYVWRQAPAKRRFRFRKRINRGMEEEHRLALTLGGVIDRALDDDEGLQSSDYSTYQIFEADNLVFKLIDLENIKTSRVGYVPRRGIMSPAYIRLERTSKQVNSRYYYWFFYGAYINNIFNGMGGGVRQNLTPTDLLEFPIPLPDLETQKTIADFLDREAIRIDQLIERKKYLNELLQKKRRALISFAVSGRLSSKEVVPSRSRWFDLLPADWSIMKLHWLARRIGDGLHSTPQYDDDGDYFFVNGNNLLREALIIKGGTRRVGQEEYRKHYIELDERTLLLSINGTIGNVGLYNGEPVILGKSAAYVKCSKNVRREYLSLVMQSEQIQNYFSSEVTGTTIYNLSLASIRNLPVPLPPTLDQQDNIVTDTSQRLSVLDGLIHKNLVSVDRVSEFRTALITAAVTGQIDLATWGKKGQTDRRLDQIEEEMSLREAHT